MTEVELSSLIADKDSFLSAMRKESVAELLKGKFEPVKKPYLHTATLSDGSKVTLKFVDTVKYLLDHKMKRIHGKDSLLSYLEIIAQPNGQKAYCRTFDIKQVVIAVPREASEAKHAAALEKLKATAATFGIDLSNPESWFRIYSESYKQASR